MVCSKSWGDCCILLSTPSNNGSWWSRWVVLPAHHCYSWWRQWSDTLWATLLMPKVTTYNHIYFHVSFKALLWRFLCNFIRTCFQNLQRFDSSLHKNLYVSFSLKLFAWHTSFHWLACLHGMPVFIDLFVCWNNISYHFPVLLFEAPNLHTHVCEE